MSELDKRTVALELAYQYKKGQISSFTDPAMDKEEVAREWAENNHMEFTDEAERLLMKLQSPL